MKTHYYLGWFNNFFPEKLERILKEDITNRKSLVLISSNPLSAQEKGSTERSWLDRIFLLHSKGYVKCIM